MCLRLRLPGGPTTKLKLTFCGLTDLERVAAGSGSLGAASSESAAGSGRLRVGSGAAAVESAAVSVVAHALSCGGSVAVGGIGWL